MSPIVVAMIKRIFDVIAAAIGLIVLAPVLFLIAIAIYLQMGPPILFTQPRPGKDSQIFTFYKFRTMSNQQDSQGNLLPDEDRVSPLGRFLRKTSLDEFPQLWNVLKGDMSIVGPRPLVVRYLNRYTPEQARRHEVKPGITGWAQVNGRNALSWDERFALDVWYVDSQSFWLDLKIIFLTVWTLFKQQGINYPGDPVLFEFKGKQYLNSSDSSECVKVK